MFFEHISTETILFFILYGVTGVVPLIAALYLLLRRGNAFAPDVTPPLRLRRWAASFFGVMALSHVWWLLLYIHFGGFHSEDAMFHSAGYAVVVVLDCVTLLTTIFGTLLAMLQDRQRPVWPVFAASVPYVALGGVIMDWPDEQVFLIATAYLLLLFVLFAVYMVFTVRQYGRWLRDNYADLERKEVWQTHVVVFFFMLLFFLYSIFDFHSSILPFVLHFFQLMFFVFLLWRVDTLPQLDSIPAEEAYTSPLPKTAEALDVPAQIQQPPASPVNINFGEIGQLLAKHCVETRLYLQHDLTLPQLAQAVGSNRSYLSQYFSRQGVTYNTYINNLRINHFISLYKETVDAGLPVVAQQLASESGYRSYSTFSLAFKQRMGQSVTAWMHSAASGS